MCDAKNLLKFENYSSLIQSPWKDYFYDVYHELPIVGWSTPCQLVISWM